MKVFLLILGGLILAGILFYVIPAILVFRYLFSGKRSPGLEERDLKGTSYEPYQEMIRDAIARFKQYEMKSVSTKSFDGKTLKGLYLDGGYEKTAILVHGYRATPFGNFAILGQFLYEEMHFNLLLPDNRATGESEGKYSGFGLLEAKDVRSWARYTERTLGAKEILIAGVSMGATAVAFTADRLNPKKVGGLILDCGFLSPEDQLLLMSEQYKPVPGRLLMPAVSLIARFVLRIDLKERTTKHLKKTRLPVLIMHGKQDETVPFYAAETAYHECGGTKRRYFPENAGHATAFYADLEKGKDAVRSFLEKDFGCEE